MPKIINEENGLSATEYAIMLALIVVVALGAIMALGVDIALVFDNFSKID